MNEQALDYLFEKYKDNIFSISKEDYDKFEEDGVILKSETAVNNLKETMLESGIENRIGDFFLDYFSPMAACSVAAFGLESISGLISGELSLDDSSLMAVCGFLDSIKVSLAMALSNRFGIYQALEDKYSTFYETAFNKILSKEKLERSSYQKEKKENFDFLIKTDFLEYINKDKEKPLSKYLASSTIFGLGHYGISLLGNTLLPSYFIGSAAGFGKVFFNCINSFSKYKSTLSENNFLEKEDVNKLTGCLVMKWYGDEIQEKYYN